MKWWQYLIIIAAFTIGSMQASLSIIGPAICVNFGIPFAKKIRNETGIDTSKIIKHYRFSVFIWFVTNTIALILIDSFVPAAYALAYGIGCVFCYLLGVKQTGKNLANFSDFVNSETKYINPNQRENFDDYMVNCLEEIKRGE